MTIPDQGTICIPKMFSKMTLKFGAACRVGLVVRVSASHTVDREFASQPGHTKDHHKNGTDCLPAFSAAKAM